MSIYFNGALITNPGAYAKVDVTGMSKVVLASAGVGSIIGIGNAGTPNIVYTFTNLSDARKVLYKSYEVESALWVSVRSAFNPSANPEIFGPSTLKVVRVGNTTDITQSTGAIKTGAAVTLITLTSKDYGTWNNFIKYKVEAGPLSGYKVTIQDPNTLEYEIYDDRADVADIVATINALSELVTAVANTTGVPATPATLTAMTGATGGGEDATDWQNALDLCKSEDINLMTVTSTDAAIHTMLDTHCKTQSAMGKKNRRAVVGGVASENVATVIARATVLNTPYTMLCAPGPKLYNDLGVLTQYAPAVTASMIMATFCGMEPPRPGTFKLLNVKGLQYNYTDDDMANLQNGHVVGVQYVSKGYRIGRSIMTTTNTEYAEMSVDRVYDYVSVGATNLFDDKFIGEGGDDTVPGQMQSALVSFLTQVWDRGYIHAGTDENGIFQPAFRNIKITGSGDTWIVEFEISPVEPINYVLVTVHAKRTTLIV